MIETDGLVGRRARDTVYSVYCVRWWCILPSALSKHTHTHDSMPNSDLSSEQNSNSHTSARRRKKNLIIDFSDGKTSKHFSTLERKKVEQFFFSFCNFALIALILCTAWYFRIYLMFLLKVTARKKYQKNFALSTKEKLPFDLFVSSISWIYQVK